jgi:hypothetical protein
VSPVSALADTPTVTAAGSREYCIGHDGYSLHRLYKAYFLRAPDEGGLAYWQDILFTGRLTLGGVSQFFSQSTEFRDRYGNLNNRAFVDLVYHNVLARDGDPEGIAWWTGLLDRGYSRGEIMVGFSDSPEFKERSGLVYPVPNATDPQVVPDIDPYTVRPGGRRDPSQIEDENYRYHRYWWQPYPPSGPVSPSEVFEWSGRELLCLGWTVRKNDLDHAPPTAHNLGIIVSSENNMVIEAYLEPDVFVQHPDYPTGSAITLTVWVRPYDPNLDSWEPVRP